MRARVEERGFPQMGAYEQRLKRLIYFLASPCAISPKNVLEGVAICREVDRHGVPSTLGKFSKAGDDPAQIVREYCLASDSLKDSCDKGSFYLSMKPPSLGFQPEHAEAIAHRAMSNGHRIHFELAQPRPCPADAYLAGARDGATLPA